MSLSEIETFRTAQDIGPLDPQTWRHSTHLAHSVCAALEGTVLDNESFQICMSFSMFTFIYASCFMYEKSGM